MEWMKYENHHVAGKRHSPDTIKICADCHQCISRWQIAAGVPLSRKSADDIESHLIYMHGLALMLERLSRIFGRMIANSAGFHANPRYRRG